MVAALADADLEEVGVVEHGGGGGVASAGVPVHARLVQVDPWIARS